MYPKVSLSERSCLPVNSHSSGSTVDLKNKYSDDIIIHAARTKKEKGREVRVSSRNPVVGKKKVRQHVLQKNDRSRINLVSRKRDPQMEPQRGFYRTSGPALGQSEGSRAKSSVERRIYDDSPARQRCYLIRRTFDVSTGKAIRRNDYRREPWPTMSRGCVCFLLALSLSFSFFLFPRLARNSIKVLQLWVIGWYEQISKITRNREKSFKKFGKIQRHSPRIDGFRTA